MPPHSDPICIIEAGIIGASAALHLIELGAQNITVIDAGQPLSGTTPAGAGFVPDLVPTTTAASLGAPYRCRVTASSSTGACMNLESISNTQPTATSFSP